MKDEFEITPRITLRDDMPCGRCDVGIYDYAVMLNKHALYLAGLSDDQRLNELPRCKKDINKVCVGATDFHNVLCAINKQ